jgi:small GTP-binding protein
MIEKYQHENIPKYDDALKIIFLGEVAVGKTSLINIFIDPNFNKNISPTLSPSYLTKLVEYENKTFLLSIWDTAGQEQYRAMNKIFIKNSNIILFIYDITNKSSLKELSFWIKYVETCIGKDSAVYGVIGNKLDLFDKEDEIKEKGQDFELVNTEEGKKFAEEIGAEFLETSAAQKAPGLDNLINKLIGIYINKNLKIGKLKKVIQYNLIKIR